jgi:hypothetical protein
MKKSRTIRSLPQPPTEIIRGAEVIAQYSPQEVHQYSNNPLIEALPPTLTPEQVTEYLLQLPPYSNKDRKSSQVARLHMTENAREFFVPNGKHLTVYYAISNMIRRGYVRRNPVLWEHWKSVHQNLDSFIQTIRDKPFPNSRARGLAIVGCGGTGKSTTAEKILQFLQQVITHNSYEYKDLILKQLVWLKLDCPRNGSLRELCHNFFRAADETLMTQYEIRYGGHSKNRTLEALISGMARVAANHCLGVLVIDEIQDLSEARSGGDITMVNFFVHLENAIGVPFALIGTQSAIPLLSVQFRQTRRISEQGYITWDRMSELEASAEELFDEDNESKTREDQTPRPDPVWKNFVETMWVYQYVKKPAPLHKNVAQDRCAHALYKVAKGIPAVVQTVFVLTQQLAILNGEETITPALIHDAVRMNLRIIDEMLGEARLKRPRTPRSTADLIDLDYVYEADDFDLFKFTDSAPPGKVLAERMTAKGREHRMIKGTERPSTKQQKSDVPLPHNGRKRTRVNPSSNIKRFRKSTDEYIAVSGE